MAIGNNVKAYLGLQPDKETLATEVVELLPTSASMENAIDTVESEAFTGFRFKEDADTTSIYPDGDFEVELTVDQLPIFLLLSGFQEESQDNVTTDLEEDVTSGATEIVVTSLAGMQEGTDITVDDGTNDETVAIDSIEPKTNTITIDTELTNDYATADGTTVTNDTITEHLFRPENVLSEWGTGLIDFTDENMYKEFRGVRGDSLSISAQQKSYITASMSTMGLEGERIDGSTVSTDYDYINEITEDRMIAFDSEIVLDGTDITATVDDIEINLNNNLDGDDYAINIYIGEPIGRNTFG
ncbi:MAG: phage tail tube protein [Halanaerobacter sp.]